eukprot:CAMPEP_0201513880 /NCGR_PEP_ID=MMETSP0161_2-20130828/5850_1 /ASSEMBLY_ACC=CAM_ASM_000251 /TAXON_ID=180227 /ORGANISM="Neoparamoeba aestuarina, Strain SoJaBio B1-5/56/2" /LENGTH=344 /DNA_ID=CAMNT_0047910265 /DNA_START=45 /DNA_END=1075 /DNA_ORIENTATION=+
MENYEKLRKLGEGAYGIVSEFKHRETGENFAIKKVRIGHDAKASKNGVNFTAIREMKILQELSHPNVVQLKEVFHRKQNIYLVYEFCVTDLERIIKKVGVLAPQHIKGFMYQILRGVDYLHKSWVLHRDIKPSNMLMTAKGVLKLADFGISRHFGSPRCRQHMSPQVVTRWYKPIELLFGARRYGVGVDMWSVGCVFAELILLKPYLPGNSDLDQISTIYKALGVPTESEWPEMKNLPCYVEWQPFAPPPLRNTFFAATESTVDLLSKFLKFNPNDRITAEDALEHAYFKEDPKPAEPAQLPLALKTNPPPSSSPASPVEVRKRPRPIPLDFGSAMENAKKKPR